MSGPHIDEALAGGAAQGSKGLAHDVSHQYNEPDAQRKEVATIAAKLCFAKFALHELSCGGYLIARWDRTIHCADLDAVRAFCRRAGVSI